MKRPEVQYLKSVIRATVKPLIPIMPYTPNRWERPSRRLEIDSAWEGLESILADLIERFHLGRERCLEFGVEHGFSTVALSSFFDSVTGVDTFLGDEHTVHQGNIYEQTAAQLARYQNIELVRSDYQNFIRTHDAFYDLIHVDIVHTFEDTYACGLWSAQHSTCTIFHDTESFTQVKHAVLEIARTTGKTFYNYTESYGLGILV